MYDSSEFPYLNVDKEHILINQLPFVGFNFDMEDNFIIVRGWLISPTIVKCILYSDCEMYFATLFLTEDKKVEVVDRIMIYESENTMFFSASNVIHCTSFGFYAIHAYDNITIINVLSDNIESFEIEKGRPFNCAVTDLDGELVCDLFYIEAHGVSIVRYVSGVVQSTQSFDSGKFLHSNYYLLQYSYVTAECLLFNDNFDSVDSSFLPEKREPFAFVERFLFYSDGVYNVENHDFIEIDLRQVTNACQYSLKATAEGKFLLWTMSGLCHLDVYARTKCDISNSGVNKLSSELGCVERSAFNQKVKVYLAIRNDAFVCHLQNPQPSTCGFRYEDDLLELTYPTNQGFINLLVNTDNEMVVHKYKLEKQKPVFGGFGFGGLAGNCKDCMTRDDGSKVLSINPLMIMNNEGNVLTRVDTVSFGASLKKNDLMNYMGNNILVGNTRIMQKDLIVLHILDENNSISDIEIPFDKKYNSNDLFMSGQSVWCADNSVQMHETGRIYNLHRFNLEDEDISLIKLDLTQKEEIPTTTMGTGLGGGTIFASNMFQCIRVVAATDVDCVIQYGTQWFLVHEELGEFSTCRIPVTIGEVNNHVIFDDLIIFFAYNKIVVCHIPDIVENGESSDIVEIGIADIDGCSKSTYIINRILDMEKQEFLLIWNREGSIGITSFDPHTHTSTFILNVSEVLSSVTDIVECVEHDVEINKMA
ncbi:hypothetical protein PCE1_003020 [Barthelona sp. PCE]